jgi:hypothetical protein
VELKTLPLNQRREDIGVLAGQWLPSRPPLQKPSVGRLTRHG